MNNDGCYDFTSVFHIGIIDDIYKWAEPFYFGYQTGCEFIYYECIDPYDQYSNYPEFCDVYDYSKTSNKCLYDENSAPYTVPVEFQYGFSTIG